MMSRLRMYVPVIVLLSIFVLWGCPKKAEVTTAPEPQKEAAPAPAKEEQKAAPMQEQVTTEMPAQAPIERAATVSAGLQPIYFDFDKSFVRDDARSIMKANAEWLKANPKVKIRIEGNCDERGTKEYNQALGQRRATSAKKYFTDMGISAKRISLISYGKEKSVCSEHTEDCWQKNRRDDFMALTE